MRVEGGNGKKRGKKANEETGGCARFEVFEGDKDWEAYRGPCVCVSTQTSTCVCGLLSICLFVTFFHDQTVIEKDASDSIPTSL